MPPKGCLEKTGMVMPRGAGTQGLWHRAPGKTHSFLRMWFLQSAVNPRRAWLKTLNEL